MDAIPNLTADNKETPTRQTTQVEPNSQVKYQDRAEDKHLRLTGVQLHELTIRDQVQRDQLLNERADSKDSQERLHATNNAAILTEDSAATLDSQSRYDATSDAGDLILTEESAATSDSQSQYNATDNAAILTNESAASIEEERPGAYSMQEYRRSHRSNSVDLTYYPQVVAEVKAEIINTNEYAALIEGKEVQIGIPVAEPGTVTNTSITSIDSEED
ncbi:hypothetical protein HOG98_06575 [bacterium]|jgi:hypothetical protein|nr:hypothetical protein [bacterium]